MSCKITATHRFEKELKKLAKKYPSLATDLRSLYKELQDNPKCGTALGRGCYKIRIAIKSKGKGKSGGGRVITYVIENLSEQINLILLSIYDKSDISTITDKELTELIEQIKEQ